MESLCNGYPMKFGRSFLSKPNDLCVHRSFSIKKHGHCDRAWYVNTSYLYSIFPENLKALAIIRLA